VCVVFFVLWMGRWECFVCGGVCCSCYQYWCGVVTVVIKDEIGSGEWVVVGV